MGLAPAIPAWDEGRVKLDREQDREVLRQAAMILEKENRRLVDENVALQRRVLALEGKSPEELQSHLAVLEEQLAVLRSRMFGTSSEKRPGPAQPHDPGRDVHERREWNTRRKRIRRRARPRP